MSRGVTPRALRPPTRLFSEAPPPRVSSLRPFSSSTLTAVSQPAPFSQGRTTVVPQSAVSVDEEKGRKLLTLGGGASLKSLVGGLNALGVTPRDMISILQAIKASGALQAEIEVM